MSAVPARVNKVFGEQMKPSPHRYALAHTAEISMALGILGALAVLLMALRSEGALILQFGVIIWIIVASLLVAAIGYIVGLIFWQMVLGQLAARLQGWPFAVGEKVRILSGPHRDTVTTVYEVWLERGQVRVDLGPEARDKVEDVYCAVAVCRAQNIEPWTAPNDGPAALQGDSRGTEWPPSVS